MNVNGLFCVRLLHAQKHTLCCRLIVNSIGYRNSLCGKDVPPKVSFELVHFGDIWNIIIVVLRFKCRHCRHRVHVSVCATGRPNTTFIYNQLQAIRITHFDKYRATYSFPCVGFWVCCMCIDRCVCWCLYLCVTACVGVCVSMSVSNASNWCHCNLFCFFFLSTIDCRHTHIHRRTNKMGSLN